MTRQIDQLTGRIGELITAIPAAAGHDGDATTDSTTAGLPAVQRLAEIPGPSSPATNTSGKAGKGNPYLKGVLGTDSNPAVVTVLFPVRGLRYC